MVTSDLGIQESERHSLWEYKYITKRGTVTREGASLTVSLGSDCAPVTKESTFDRTSTY